MSTLPNSTVILGALNITEQYASMVPVNDVAKHMQSKNVRRIVTRYFTDPRLLFIK
jgi:hypothetical protein